MAVRIFEDEVAYWRTLAEEREAELVVLRNRLLAIAMVAPTDLLTLVEGGAQTQITPGQLHEIFEGWEDTPVLRPSDVATEMALLWERLASWA